MSLGSDEFFLQHALLLARHAAAKNEVPVGAVVVHENKIIGEGFNQPVKTHDPSAHAEILALRAAAQSQKNYRLLNTTLYVTLEPCLMCAAAMVHARIQRVVFGAYDPKAGAVTSCLQTLEFPWLNHRVLWRGGVLAEECGAILKQFFRDRR